MLNWLEIEDTIKLLEESERNGEEVEIQCPVEKCSECPFEKYCH